MKSPFLHMVSVIMEHFSVVTGALFHYFLYDECLLLFSAVM